MQVVSVVDRSLSLELRAEDAVRTEAAVFFNCFHPVLFKSGIFCLSLYLHMFVSGNKHYVCFGMMSADVSSRNVTIQYETSSYQQESALPALCHVWSTTRMTASIRKSQWVQWSPVMVLFVHHTRMSAVKGSLTVLSETELHQLCQWGMTEWKELLMLWIL